MNGDGNNQEHEEKEDSLLTDLCNACRDGEIEKVKRLLKSRHLNPWSKVTYILTRELPRTPLIEACLHNHVDLVQILLDNGEDVNETDIDGFTPLQAYLKEGAKKTFNKDSMSQMTSLLLSNRADPNFQETDSYSTLILGVLSGSQKVVELLLDAGADPNYINRNLERHSARFYWYHGKFLWGLSAVHACILQHENLDNGIVADWKQKRRLAKTLIDKGFAVDKTDVDGNDLLLLYLQSLAEHCNKRNLTEADLEKDDGFFEFLNLLLETVGGNVNHKNKHGETALILSAKSCFRKITNYLLERQADIHVCYGEERNNVLHACCTLSGYPCKVSSKEDWAAITRKLVVEGLDVDKTNEAGFTPLHWLFKETQALMRRTLIVNSAQKIVMDDMRLLEMTNVLIDLGADPRKCITTSSSALHAIYTLGYRKTAERLLGCGACIRVCVDSNTSVLHAACKNVSKENLDSKLELMSRSTEEGINVNGCDANNKSVLLSATQNLLEMKSYRNRRNILGILDFLLQSNADPNVCSMNGSSPLLMAAQYNDLGIVSRLISAGANVNHKGTGSETPLIACLHPDAVTKCGIKRRCFDEDGNIQDRLQNQTQIIDLLIEHGADVNAITDKGITPLKQSFLALKEFRKSWILHHVDNWENIIHQTVTKLLDSGADPNLTKESFDSPLICAIMSCSIEGTRSLLAVGADVNITDCEGKNLMEIIFATDMCTEENERVHIATMLMEKDICFELEPENDNPLLYKALKCLSAFETDESIVSVVNFLLSKGANPNSLIDDDSDWEDSVPMKSSFDSRTLTTTHSIWPWREPRRKKSLLWYAVRYCSSGVVEALINGGSDLGESGRSLLSTCLENKKTCNHVFRDLYKKIEILLIAGVHVDDGDEPGFLTTLYSNFVSYLKEVTNIITRNMSSYKTYSMTERKRKHRELSNLLLDTTKLLCSYGLKLTEKGLLQQAVVFGSYDCVQYLLEEGATHQGVDSYSNTPLHHAVGLRGCECQYPPLHDRFDLAELLIKHGASINARNAQHKSPFDLAVEHVLNAEEIEKQKLVLFLKFLLENGAEIDASNDGDDFSRYARKSRQNSSSYLNAVKENDVEVVRLFLQFGADVKSTDENGNDALSICLRQNDVCEKTETMVKLLVMHGANVNGRDKERNPRYWYYRSDSSKTALQLLLENLELSDWSDVATTQSKSFLSMLRWLIANGADVNMARDNTRPASMQAVGLNSLEIVNLLLSSGAKVNITYKEEFTPLGVSCINDCENDFNLRVDRPDRLSMVKVLVENGADTNFMAPRGLSPLQLLTVPNATSIISHIRYFQKEYITQRSTSEDTDQLEMICLPIIEYLLKNRANPNVFQMGYPPLMASANLFSTETIRLLIQYGADVNINGDSALTPLQTCCSAIDLCDKTESTVKLLINHGADVNGTDKEQKYGCSPKTPLQLLLEKRKSNAMPDVLIGQSKAYLNILRCLVANGANVNMAEKRTCPPLMQAVSLSSLEIVHLLVSSGANLNITHMDLLTPLGLACINDCEGDFSLSKDRPDRLAIIKLLVDFGADTNFRASCGFSSLQFLMSPDSTCIVRDYGYSHRKEDSKAETNQLEKICLPILEYLLEKGANPNAFKRGDPPISLSVDIGSTRFTQLLIHFGADVNIKGEDDLTPLQTCCTAVASQMASEGKNLSSFFSTIKTLVEAEANLKHGFKSDSSPVQLIIPNDNHPSIYSKDYRIDGTSRGQHEEYIQIVEYLIKKGASVNASDKNHKSPLVSAILWKNEALVQLLLLHGADVNFCDRCRRTPLHICCKNVDIVKLPKFADHEIVAKGKLLLQYGADVNKVDRHGRTPIEVMLEGFLSGSCVRTISNIGIITRLADLYIKAGANVNTCAKNLRGKSALTIAVFLKQKSLVELLLQAGSNVNAISTVHGTALTTCCRNFEIYRGSSEHLDIATILLQHGADANLSPAGRVNEGALVSLVDRIIKCGDISRPAACLLRLLLENGADANVLHGTNNLLLNAVSHGNTDLVSILLSHGANVHEVTDDGSNALHICLSSNKTLKIKKKMVETLALWGVNMNLRDKTGCTPMDLFCESITPKNQLDRPLQKELLHILASCEAKPKTMARKDTVSKLIRNGNYKIARYLLQTCMTLELDDAILSATDTIPISRKEVKEKKFMEIALSRNSDVPSLSVFCRKVIREHLVIRSINRNITDDIGRLGLPRSLSKFLQFGNEFLELVAVGHKSPFCQLGVHMKESPTQGTDTYYSDDEKSSTDLEGEESECTLHKKLWQMADSKKNKELRINIEDTKEDKAYNRSHSPNACGEVTTQSLKKNTGSILKSTTDLLNAEALRSYQAYNEECEIVIERDSDGGTSKELMKIPKRWDDWDFSDDEDVRRVGDYCHDYDYDFDYDYGHDYGHYYDSSSDDYDYNNGWYGYDFDSYNYYYDSDW